MIRSTPILWFRDDIDPVVEFYTHALGDVREVTRMTYPAHSWFVDIEPSLSNATMAAFLSVGGSPLTIIRGRSELLREEHITFTLNFQSLPATDVAEAMTKTWNRLVAGGTVIDQLTEYEGGRMYGRLTDRYGIHWNFLNAIPGEVVDQFLITNFLFSGKNQNKAAEALNFYVDSFSETRKGDVFYYPESDGLVTTESIMYSEFMIHDTYVIVNDVGYEIPDHSGMSVMFGLFCETADELNQLWEHFSSSGAEYGHFGIVTDKYDLNWLICPYFVWNNCEDSQFIDAFAAHGKADFEMLKQLARPSLTRQPEM